MRPINNLKTFGFVWNDCLLIEWSLVLFRHDEDTAYKSVLVAM